MTQTNSRLSAPPPHVVIDCAPANGRYAGRIAEIDWRELSGLQRRSALWRRLHHKRWQYVGLGNADVLSAWPLLTWVVAASHYIQPVGTFSGWVKASSGARPYAVNGLLGVTEDHQSRW